jgi:hypothetical protein
MMAIFYALAAALLALVTTPAFAAPDRGPTREQLTDAAPNPYFLNIGLVERIVCGDAAGTSVGTGARIDVDIVLTANHVVKGRPCLIDGEPAELLHADPALDVAVLRAATKSYNGTRMLVSCEPVAPGQTYYGVGWAFSADLAVQRFVATNGKSRDRGFEGEMLMRGNGYPGMSGGPVIDANGFIVGIVNGSQGDGLSLMASRSVRDTFLCKAPL